MKDQKHPYKYFSNQELQQQMAKIHDYKFRVKADEQDKQACKEITKGFSYVIPYVDRYVMLLKQILITDQDIDKHYGKALSVLPPNDRLKQRNKIKRAADAYNRGVLAAADDLQGFVDKQAQHLNALEDELAEELMELTL